MEKHKIIEALRKLDPENPQHWTENGMPLVTAVAKLAGITGITRDDITAAAPDFTRESRTFDGAPAEAVAPETVKPPLDLDALHAADEKRAQEISRLEVEKRELEDSLRTLRERQGLLEHEASELEKKIQAVHEKIIGNAPVMSNQEAILYYQKQQNIQRAKSAGEQGPAPIDAAFRRRTGYGGGRPKTPVMAK